MREPPILDMCCGSRMFWFNKQDSRAVYLDARAELHTLCDDRKIEIRPDVIGDFRKLPFADGQFNQVIFDPPHLRRAGARSWMRKKYGQLDKENWPEDLRAGFTEAFRVLAPGGTLVFKWNATQIPVSKILALTDQLPTIWQRTGKADKTHWILFTKDPSVGAPDAVSDDLVMQIRRLVHALKSASPDHSLVKSVSDYMRSKGYWKVTDYLRIPDRSNDEHNA